MSAQPFEFDTWEFVPPTIPARGSSSKYHTYSSIRNRILAVKQSRADLQQTLKRKASNISAFSSGSFEGDKAANDFLETAIEHRSHFEDELKLTKKALNELYKYKEISKEDYLNTMRDVLQKQAKLYAGDVTLKRQRERHMANIAQAILENGRDEADFGRALSTMLQKIVDRTVVDRNSEQRAFRPALINWYGVQPGGKKAPIWCPLLQEWGRNLKAAHLVPFKLGYETMGEIFGEPGKGYELMWSMGNGLMMDKQVEEAFDEHRFCLLPIERPGKPDGWKIVLLDESIRHVERPFDYISKTWHDLDGKELRFLNDHRPQRRFLYFHYCICILKMVTKQIEGWELARDKTKTGKMWATPGPYLRASMLKKLALQIGDVELPEELTRGHGIDESLLSEDLVETCVKDLGWTSFDNEMSYHFSDDD